jgi:hypothetical protein
LLRVTEPSFGAPAWAQALARVEDAFAQAGWSASRATSDMRVNAACASAAFWIQAVEQAHAPRSVDIEVTLPPAR